MTTTSSTHRRSRGPSRPDWTGAATGTDALPAEERLVVLLSGTEQRRHARAQEAAELADTADPRRLGMLMKRQGMTVLLGGRLLALGVDVDAGLVEEIESARVVALQQGDRHELVTMGLLSALARDGIRAMPLKGSVLAQQVHGSVAARTAGDIDILVASRDLGAAIAALQSQGWKWLRRSSRASRLPVLHEGLVHPVLPAVDMHWRVHWYEDRFAADALARGESQGSGPLAMTPADGLAALILFYARDGFSGLRMAADVGAWWDTRCEGADAGAMLADTVARYPALAGPLTVAAQLLGPLVGFPGAPRHLPLRWRAAGELADPLAELGANQKNANVSLVDVLLAPPGGVGDALRRERQKIPEDLERPLTPADGLAVHLERGEHLLRVLRRWGLTGPPAFARAVTPRGLGRPEPY